MEIALYYSQKQLDIGDNFLLKLIIKALSLLNA